ncbi:MAG TPA: phosphatidylglycerophosphatase A [Ramlibacter sp.]|jgi:phosphatidylglycerophosphatase A|nr:phosphatidylglycerophosphatase A [Ramlibacter sp.]
MDAPPLAALPRRPTAAFMLSHPAHAIALGFGSGLAPIAPGTLGTLWAWIAFAVLQLWLSPWQMGQLILLSLPLGWWACTVTARNMGVADPAAIVWDEIVCFWIILWLMAPASWGAQFGAFVVFRLFDALKPGPIGWADRTFKGYGWRGGFGILADDLVAAFCTLVVLALWRHWT